MTSSALLRRLLRLRHHRIEIRGRAHVAADGADFIGRRWPQMTWVDRAAMHLGTTTELDSGNQVDDSCFTAAGWDYDERIMFEPVGSILAPDASGKWKVSGGVATHVAGLAAGGRRAPRRAKKLTLHPRGEVVARSRCPSPALGA